MDSNRPERPPRPRGRDLPKPTPSDLEATRVFHAAPALHEVVLPPAEALEELEEDAIVGQASDAHEPLPATEIAVEHRRVVISEMSPADMEEPASEPLAAHGASAHAVPGGSHQKGAAPRKRERRISEPTLVMRDRRQLEELRRQLLAEHALLHKSRAVWMWGALAVLGVTAVLLLVVLATRRGKSSEVLVLEGAAAKPPEGFVDKAPERPPGALHPTGVDRRSRARPRPSSDPAFQADPVDLTELPLEK